MTYEESVTVEAEREAMRLVGRPYIKPSVAGYFAFAAGFGVSEVYLGLARVPSLAIGFVLFACVVFILGSWERRFQRIASNEWLRIDRENGLRSQSRAPAQ
ncbi:hypothetical protein V1282_000903 [Nitrobacteraceae bacterium AZCC 2146]